MIEVDESCQEHFQKVAAFAAEYPERLIQFVNKLEYLSTYGERREDVTSVRTVLTADFAPYSFNFYTFWNDEETPFMRGGLIFHGSHDNGGDGGAPTYSVNINPVTAEHGEWRVHT